MFQQTFINIAESSIFSPYTKLLPYGVYLFGSANITKLSDSQSEVVLTFNDLKCKHERNYKCTLSVHQAAPTDSAPMDIFVGAEDSFNQPPECNDYHHGEFPGNCSYYRTSNLTFQVTAEDNNAVIRCVIVSPLAEENMFVDSEQIEVKYHVRIPTVTKYPDKHEYIAGVDSSITLTCTSDGNPKPIYHWYKDNHGDIISIAENLTLMNINTTDRGLYTCYVSNTINGLTFTEVASIEVNIMNEAVIVVGAVSGSIILNFKVSSNSQLPNITETNVNTTQQHNSPYDGVGHVLDVRNYDELSTKEHQYTNTNLMSS
ncbi:unnamed protein product [Mytilus edulis]|uniref:Ig-like domain-containing protein n=1 Tax=Mytilus edulis TaxID=6550 RepID=A0A8S3Q971_MYTED|nr:unnamed protein product [Mytilus edulis]